ncbi:MAG: hypothetical protein ACYSPJ_03665 [Planctomycetota bacterium]
MKKFIWPLQRLLDIKVKQEDFARIELVTITEKIVIIRGQIMMQKMVLRNLFSELNQLDPFTKTLNRRSRNEKIRLMRLWHYEDFEKVWISSERKP